VRRVPLAPTPLSELGAGPEIGLSGSSSGGALLEKVYEAEEVAGKEPQLKVNYMYLIMPRQAFWEASLGRSDSTTRC
jgi:hypothetical protein